MRITKRQLRRIIREASEHAAEARGMAAAYSQGYNDAYRGPGYKKRGNREYLRGYQQGVADVEQGKPPPDDFRPARRIREADGSTKKYDDDSALKGGQSKLPDGLQKGIIDKTVEDREEHEEEEREEKNESARITKRQLRIIIREVQRLPDQAGPPLWSYAQDFEDVLNGWLYKKVTLKYVKGTTYLIKRVEASAVPEVKEEIQEFGARFEYELGSGTTRDIGVSFGG